MASIKKGEAKVSPFFMEQTIFGKGCWFKFGIFFITLFSENSLSA